jgi:molecular chaperone DnaK
MQTMIERNSLIPMAKSETFTTGYENQPSIQIQIYEGESEVAVANKLLGNFELTGSRLLRVACRRSRSPSTAT